jgi:hypothetical protein
MTKLKILILFLILLIVFLLLFPSFYFNELEYQGKQIYTSIEASKQATFDAIEQRSGREGGIKTDEEYIQYSTLITENLNKMEIGISKHQNILNQQEIITFLLLPKYKKYYGLKKETFDKYYSSLKNFKKLKESETFTMDALIMRNEFAAEMKKFGQSKDLNTDKLSDLIKKNVVLIAEAKIYFDGGYITEESL